MADRQPIDGSLSPIKRALHEIRDLREQLAREKSRHTEPIAIVGMGMRLPGGVRDAASFAELLWSGRDAVTTIPAERWSLEGLYADDPDAPGRMITRYGAFVDRVDAFDAEFFGISPREAATMDPQQRLLLEVAWEALEDAGHAGPTLAGSRAGVYLGIANNDYGRALYSQPDAIDAYFGTGNAYSVAAGRLSYFLGVHGPSLAIDTACSSSLVALHLACQGLRLGECDLALAGGVNLILTPEMNITFSKARMMAPDGKCKTFDATADGYVRGEGCAVVVLKRLSDAIADRDRILAVVRGTAVNQDGRSGGLTAPNGPAQEAAIRAALAAAGLPPGAVSYVEAHGTGTPLGDPIEVGALNAALCENRDARRPLHIGSVKTNLGHLEAAAGIAGIIKVVLALQRREIPPQLHFTRGNPHIDWQAWPVNVPVAITPWEAVEGRRIAGISSFGFSGTNAHAILEEAPAAVSETCERERPIHVLALSARDEQSLHALAARYESHLSTNATRIADVCFSANAGRTHFSHRLAIAGARHQDFVDGLRAYLAGEPSPTLAVGSNQGIRPQVAFLFTGLGAQHPGVGLRLYETSPVFRSALDSCAALFGPEIDRPLLDVLFASDATRIMETRYGQPATFAIEFALAQLWKSWGIVPAVVLGHSLGEYAAACVVGVFSLPDAVKVVAQRGRLSQELAKPGTMAAVFGPYETVAAEISRSNGAITVAAYNGPEHFVISGLTASVEAALGRLEASGVKVKPLRVPYAAHSPLVEPVCDAFKTVLESVRFGTPHTPIISNVTGALPTEGELERPEYWLSHMREPVRFAESMRVAAALGITHFVEVGPHPVLLGMAAECLPDSPVEWLPSLRRDREDWSDLVESLQRLYVCGADVDWSAFDRGHLRNRVALPKYPFRQRRHWADLGGRGATSMTAAERWSRLTEQLGRQAEQGPLDLNAASYPRKWECLARLTHAHASRTLRDAGLFTRSGERHTLDEVLTLGGIGGAYRHLVQRWLEGLVASGVLRQEGFTFIATAALPEPQMETRWAEAEELFSDNQPLLAYVRHCGSLVSDVLTGAEGPLETLFPGGSWDLAQGLYERSSTMRYVNGLAAAALASLAAATPSGHILRVLEIGAGTGGTTSSLLPVLRPESTRYRFTDVSDVFFDRARTRFAAYPFVEFGRLNMDVDPLEQGYAPGSFDVIVSANAVHATTDLRSAMRRIRDLLAPGGVLVLVESTAHLAWFDMTTGLIEGWQHFADDLRTDNPLLPPETWIRALQEEGFAAADAWPSRESVADSLGQHLIVARVVGEPFGSTERRPSDEVTAVAAPTATNAIRGPQESADELRRRLMEALSVDRLAIVRDVVRDAVVRVLKLGADEAPGRHVRLMDAGLDSLMAVQLRNQLARAFDLPRKLPATLMFDYPTIEALAGHLLERVQPREDAVIPALAATATVEPHMPRTDVAGMSDAEVEALLLQRLEKS
jgi:acyl transferase domain-containing protein/SAM-dependent methyltransferase